MRKIFYLMISVLLSAFNLNAEVLKSPNGNLVVHFDLKDGIPYYKVEYKNMAVINESSLGLELKDAPALLEIGRASCRERV